MHYDAETLSTCAHSFSKLIGRILSQHADTSDGNVDGDSNNGSADKGKDRFSLLICRASSHLLLLGIFIFDELYEKCKMDQLVSHMQVHYPTNSTWLSEIVDVSFDLVGRHLTTNARTAIDSSSPYYRRKWILALSPVSSEFKLNKCLHVLASVSMVSSFALSKCVEMLQLQVPFGNTPREEDASSNPYGAAGLDDIAELSSPSHVNMELQVELFHAIMNATLHVDASPAVLASTLCPAVTVENIKALCGSVPVTKYTRGHVVVREGDIGKECFLIRRGQVHVETTDDTGKLVTLHTYEDGAIFGEMALFRSEKRTANVVADTDLEVVIVSREVFSRARAMANESNVELFDRGLAAFAFQPLLRYVRAKREEDPTWQPSAPLVQATTQGMVSVHAVEARHLAKELKIGRFECFQDRFEKDVAMNASPREGEGEEEALEKEKSESVLLLMQSLHQGLPTVEEDSLRSYAETLYANGYTTVEAMLALTSVEELQAAAGMEERVQADRSRDLFQWIEAEAERQRNEGGDGTGGDAKELRAKRFQRGVLPALKAAAKARKKGSKSNVAKMEQLFGQNNRHAGKVLHSFEGINENTLAAVLGTWKRRELHRDGSIEAITVEVCLSSLSLP